MWNDRRGLRRAVCGRLLLVIVLACIAGSVIGVETGRATVNCRPCYTHTGCGDVLDCYAVASCPSFACNGVCYRFDCSSILNPSGQACSALLCGFTACDAGCQ